MAHINKKGKLLTTKRRNNKSDSKKKISQLDFENNTSIFDNFVFTRTSKQKNNDSHLSEESNDQINTQENDIDLFKFPGESSRCSVANNMILETTTSPQPNVFEEETKINISILDSCVKSRTEEKLNNSSIFFENNSEINDKKEDSCSATDGCVQEMSFCDSVLIPEILDVKKLKPSITTDVTLPEETENSERDETNQCPVCLKTIGESKYLSHMKSCASKNKLSTQQLLSALKLHKKQLAERKELGLGIPVQSYKARVSPKRSRINERKGPVDSSLQLALALSASLHSAQEVEVIQEAEALKEAGLSDEAEQKLSTLEKYGFASTFPLQQTAMAGRSKSRPAPPSLLLRRTQDERERIITEKVAIILISEEESMQLSSFTQANPNLKSKLLKKSWNNECQLWTKAHCSEDEKREAFYVETLSQFVIPSKFEVGEGLRRLSQLPGRVNTPIKENISDTSSPCKSLTEFDEAWIAEMPTPWRPVGLAASKSPLHMKEADISDLPTPARSEVSGGERRCDVTPLDQTKLNQFSSISLLSDDWEKLVNNSVLSDIKILCKDCVVIPAHKLVFYVRCPRTLDGLVKQKTNEDVLEWEHFSVNSVLAFLTFLYCGRTKKIMTLNSEDFLALKIMVERFDCKELKNFLNVVRRSGKKSDKSVVKKELFKSCDVNIRVNIENPLASCDHKATSEFSFSEHFPRNNGVENTSSTTESDLNYETLKSGRESPDMFGDPSVTGSEMEFQEDRDDLDILVSLMGKPTQYKSDSTSLEKGEVVVVDSPSGSCTSEVSRRKRKVSDTSICDDEDVSLSKKHHPNVSESDHFENKGKRETLDLTQSSDSSNGEAFRKSLGMSAKDKSVISDIKNKEESFDLTQSSVSSNEESYKDIKSNSKNIECQEESGEDESLIDLTQKENSESISYNCRLSPMNEDYSGPVEIGDHHEGSSCNADLPKELPEKTVEGKSITALNTPRFSSSQIINTSKCLSFSGRKSLSDRSLNSPCNTSESNKCDDVLLEDNVQDYIDPVWEGFDDYYQFNCANNSLNTPIRYQKDGSLNVSSCRLNNLTCNRFSVSPKSSTADISPTNNSPKHSSLAVTSPTSIKSISSDTKFPKSLQKLTPTSSSSIKYLSSESKSPKYYSQKVLNCLSPTLECRPKQKYNDLTISEPDHSIPKNSSAKSTRKNLTFQFEADLNSTEIIDLEKEENNLPGSLKCQNNSPKSSLKKDSLSAMQRLLDDSFEINDSLFDAADALASRNNDKEVLRPSKNFTGQQTEIVGSSSLEEDGALVGNSKSQTSLDTPSPGIIVSDEVTPLPNYSGMKTPALKKELSRFGLKPSLGRRKAKLLLRYIYDQTHPVVPASQDQELFRIPDGQPPRSPVKDPSKTQSTSRKTKTADDSSRNTQMVSILTDSESESDDPCSQMSTSSISSTASLPEESFHEAEDILTQDLSDKGDVHSCIRKLIKGDAELHKKVLMYEPIYLEDLMATLRTYGIKSKPNDVMDFLDEQCITFRTNSWKATNEKRRQKQKSPKKKMKQPLAAGESLIISPTKSKESLGISPTKSQTHLPKKRGRPKKTDKQSTTAIS